MLLQVSVVCLSLCQFSVYKLLQYHDMLEIKGRESLRLFLLGGEVLIQLSFFVHFINKKTNENNNGDPGKFHCRISEFATA